MAHEPPPPSRGDGGPKPPIVYLDNAATTPLAPEVFAAMEPYLRDRWGNPSSNHPKGIEARLGVERARRHLAKALGCSPEELFFVGGGSEASNLAIKGAALRELATGGTKRHVVTLATEHKATLQAVHDLESWFGFEATIVGVDREGIVDLDAFAAALRPDTLLASAMHGNNETGALQPVAELAALCRERGVLFHCDGVQAVGHLPVDARALCVDLYSTTAHKLHGPKGIGALYVREGVKIQPLIAGGGQEGGLRAGTENVAGIVGFGAAAALAMADLDVEIARLRGLRERLWEGLRAAIPGIVRNGPGDAAKALPGVLSVSIHGANGQELVAMLGLEAGVCCSAGSACSTDPTGGTKKIVSHVLRAMGLPDDLALGTLRFSVGRYTTEAEIDRALELVGPVVSRERAASA